MNCKHLGIFIYSYLDIYGEFTPIIKIYLETILIAE